MKPFQVLTLTENGVQEVSSPELLDGSFVFVQGKDGALGHILINGQ